MASNSKNLAELLNGDVTVTATDIADGSVTSAKLANDAVTTAKIPDDAITAAKIGSGAVEGAMVTPFGRRNIVINGAMQVWQRGTSFTGVNSSVYHTDRFQSYNSSNASGESTVSKSTDAPDGFGNSYKLEVTTADSSLHVSAEYGLYHYFEGQDLQGLKKGTSDAKSLTASFWVKSSVTGTFIVELMDNDNSNRHINKSYTINAANTWEYKTITFEGDTVGALDNDNNNSFHINWWLGGGTSFTSGTLQTSWGTLSQTSRAVGQTNVHATVGNTWYLTGVQLEVGSVATPFEYRSYGEELSLCQRYYQRISGGSDAFVYAGKGQGSSSIDATIPLPVPLRASPTMNSLNTRVFYNSGSFSSSTATPTANQFSENNPQLAVNCSGFSGLTNNHIYNWAPLANFLEIDAEL